MSEPVVAPIRVLIVDDHPLLRDGISACLCQDPGIALVGQAGNGEEALQEALRLRPDLVLMDISMGRLDGIEATRQLCAALPQTRVLILTMHDKPHYVVPAIEAGARGYVLKSAGGADLLRGIRAVHHGARYFSEGVEYPPPRLPPDPPDPPTNREIEVLCLIARGLSAKEIARTLDISPRTVESHCASIRAKLGIRNAVGLARYAMAHPELCPGLSQDGGGT